MIVNSRMRSLSTTRSMLKISMVANRGEKMIKQPTEKLNWTNDPRNFSEEISDKLYSKIESNQIYKPLKSYIITVKEDTRYLMAGRLLKTFYRFPK